MTKVYAPQQPSRFDNASRLWVPTVNLTPAEQYGELVIMLPPEAYRLHTGPLVAAMKEQMKDFKPGDYIVAVGDPSLIAAAAVIASRKSGGVLNLLKWDRMASHYLPVEIIA